MNRRVLWLAVALAAVAVVGFSFWWVLPPADRVTKANYDRLRTHMSPADVRALLGEPTEELPAPPWPFAPGGGLAPAADLAVAADVLGLALNRGMPTHVWHGRRHDILVGYIDGRVAYTEIRDLTPPPSVLERVRRWVGL